MSSDAHFTTFPLTGPAPSGPLSFVSRLPVWVWVAIGVAIIAIIVIIALAVSSKDEPTAAGATTATSTFRSSIRRATSGRL